MPDARGPVRGARRRRNRQPSRSVSRVPAARPCWPRPTVTTTAAPVPVQGGTCSGTSAGGALYDATHGNWKATLEPEGVEIDGIQGLNLPSFAEGTYAYWAFWLNNEYALVGACAEEVGAGRGHRLRHAVLRARRPSAPNRPAPPITSSPLSRPLDRGAARRRIDASVKVGSLSTQTGSPESLPAQTLISAGSQSVAPDPNGTRRCQLHRAGHLHDPGEGARLGALGSIRRLRACAG